MGKSEILITLCVWLSEILGEFNFEACFCLSFLAFIQKRLGPTHHELKLLKDNKRFSRFKNWKNARTLVFTKGVLALCVSFTHSVFSRSKRQRARSI